MKNTPFFFRPWPYSLIAAFQFFKLLLGFDFSQGWFEVSFVLSIILGRIEWEMYGRNMIFSKLFSQN